MRRRVRERRPSAGLLVAVLALVAAIAGTALASPGANSSVMTKAKVKKIATNQIKALAPSLSVAHADTSGSADSAHTADTAIKATTADSAVQADNATNAGDAGTLDDLDSTQFQRSGASGTDTAGAETVPADGSTSTFPVVGGTFTYHCFASNAGWGWVPSPGGGAEMWQDQGGGNPFHFDVPLGVSGAIDTNDSDRYEYVFSSANRIAFLDLYSFHSGSECSFAYQLSEYQR